MSEFAIIARHFQHCTQAHPDTVLGIGDDCAISRVPAGCELVSCIDTLVAGRHFVHHASAHASAHKAAAVNLSDLASMGATPYALLLGLSLPPSLASDAFLKEFARGLGEICAQFGVSLIGGDTTSAQTLTISITALGYVPQGMAIRRSGAVVGDLVCVSGEIGSASYALPFALADKPCLLSHALDYPVPQLILGQRLRGVAHSMIDISDGLAQDLGHILAASGVGAVIDLERIPCHPLLSELPDAQRWQHQLNGGDDYQLCLTLPPAKFIEFNQRYPDTPIYPIGQITDASGLVLQQHGEVIDLDVRGWQHF